MPIYEYTCSKCRFHFEELILSGDPKVTCPKCASARVSREMSVFSAPSGGRTEEPCPADPGRPSCGGTCAYR